MKKIAFILTAITLTQALSTQAAPKQTLSAQAPSSDYAWRYEPEKFVLEQELEAVSDPTRIRAGAGERFAVMDAVHTGELMEVIGIIGDWYVVCLKTGVVGVVSKGDVRVTKISGSYIEEDERAAADNGSASADFQESLMFSLVNASRAEHGLTPYEWDGELNAIARLKAEDIANSENISHVSEKYGTPFKMLKSMYAPYKSASENIVAGESAYYAHAAMMSKPQNRANILARYDKMGVGVAKSELHGEVIVQMFVRD
ncbi:MAG: CAP domain-containing protein [Clostridiales bacterium]|jgi:hypothetical protein|nr:CAP domain-containing protein [Clostridiales bacterium]